MRSPQVSIIVNCFNGERFLGQALDSIRAQTFTDWEVIFWDNQSTDRSAEIFRGYNDPRFRYFYAPEHTLLYAARALALPHSQGDLIAFLDVDDWWAPEKLQRQVPLFEDPELGLACSNYWVVRDSKKSLATQTPWPTGHVLDDLLAHYFVALPTLVVRRSALEQLAYGIDPRFHIIGDFDLVIRIAAQWKLGCVHEPMAYYRLHENNETAKKLDQHVDELELWQSGVALHPHIAGSPNFTQVATYASYVAAMSAILDGRRATALKRWTKMPWGKLKVRLSAGLLLPAPVVRKLKK